MAELSMSKPPKPSGVSGRASHLLAVLFVGLGLSACVQVPGTVRIDPAAQSLRGAKVLIMQPDVEVSELTLGGLLEPNAAWTAAA